MSTPTPLDPLRFPLSGSHLIEASAGTGKTFTIAALYVRLVLGHGGGQGFSRPLTPPEILVVTFTEAATKELRDRIRTRLTTAAAAFREPVETAPEDSLLARLRADYPQAEWPMCARRLQLAAEWMDEAAVSTIHGWCNRMLREHAFDSGSLFAQSLDGDDAELQAEAVRDYWRRFLVPLPLAAAAEVRGWWSDPTKLQQALRNLLGHVGALAEARAPALAIDAATGERQRRLAALKAPWQGWLGELQQLLDEAREGKAFNGQKLKKNNYDSWLQSLAAWRDDPERRAPGLTDAAKSRLSEAGLAEIWKQGEPPRHEALAALAALDAAIAELPDARAEVLAHATRWVAARFAEEQRRRAQMGFDDLLTRLDAALQGENGERLANAIRQAFPAALIDEFQDTDPVQYRIFNAVYRVADNSAETALILIGDPKQAIYAFRGADLHTYLAARRDSAGRLHTLRRNFRSSVEMVAAVNRCFALAEERPAGAGAFLLRRGDDDPVPFLPAEANGCAERFVVAGGSCPALTMWHLPPADDGKPLGVTAYRTRIAESCAGRIAELLNRGAQGEAGFVSAERLRALRPADIAVLVNTGREAQAMRRALAVLGVRSVYLSESDSVFQSPRVAELQLWLGACAEPDDGRRLRAALATPSLGLGWLDLDRLNSDELQWERRVQQFRGYRECWRRQGVLPMLRRLLHDFEVPARLLAMAGGERDLTDLLHLAELLQQASALLDGEHALLRHLDEQCAEGNGAAAGDPRQVRLESDADLVQVVTVHKSKGLEYPLVFLPFAAAFRPVKKDDLPLKYHDDAGDLQLLLSADESAAARADRERLGEDLRKLYVALTRARHATFVGLAPLTGLEGSAIGYLLGGGETIEPAQLPDLLRQLQDDAGAVVIESAPTPTGERYVAAAASPAPGPARQPGRRAREHWWIASYSSLRTADGDPGQAADTAIEELLREDAVAVAAALWEPNGAPTPHNFPRGAAAGSFLHGLLEWAAQQGLAALSANPGPLRDIVARRCQLRGWERWIDPLTDWLLALISRPLPLPGGALSLCRLPALMAEMEFWLAAHHVDIHAIETRVRAGVLPGAARPALQPGQLNGMLKGFIDLVFEHEGLYYVADYKSNWLGPNAAAYTVAAMREAVLHARYELQYSLYLLALHRLLKARLPDYDYDRHVGGALCLFLRGIDGETSGVHFERPPRQLIEGLDQLFQGCEVNA